MVNSPGKSDLRRHKETLEKASWEYWTKLEQRNKVEAFMESDSMNYTEWEKTYDQEDTTD